MRAQLRAISPVIATVIIVAVALAIAVAVVGWLMGLWSGLAAGTPQIAVTNVKVFTNGTADVYIKNSGSGSDIILRAELVYGSTSVSLNPASSSAQCIVINADNTVTVEANCAGWLRISPATAQSLSAGDTVLIKLYFEKSGTQTIQGVVSP